MAAVRAGPQTGQREGGFLDGGSQGESTTWLVPSIRGHFVGPIGSGGRFKSGLVTQVGLTFRCICKRDGVSRVFRHQDRTHHRGQTCRRADSSSERVSLTNRIRNVLSRAGNRPPDRGGRASRLHGLLDWIFVSGKKLRLGGETDLFLDGFPKRAFACRRQRATPLGVHLETSMRTVR
jgi:hypothetical protein